MSALSFEVETLQWDFVTVNLISDTYTDTTEEPNKCKSFPNLIYEDSSAEISVLDYI